MTLNSKQIYYLIIFDISRINNLIPLDNARAKGYLTVSLNINNTFDNPQINGELYMDQGNFRYNTLGMYYNNIHLSSKLINNHFHLDSLNLFSKKGKLQLKGQIDIDSLFQGGIDF